MKICSKCKIKKPLIEYCIHKLSKDGFQTICKSCQKNYSKQYKPTTEQTKRWKNKWASKISAVYEITSNNECLYVGQSKRFSERKSKHKVFIKNPNIAEDAYKNLYKSLSQHSNIVIDIVEECKPNLLIEREQYYIQQLKPKYNTYGI